MYEYHYTSSALEWRPNETCFEKPQNGLIDSINYLIQWEGVVMLPQYDHSMILLMLKLQGWLVGRSKIDFCPQISHALIILINFTNLGDFFFQLLIHRHLSTPTFRLFVSLSTLT
jgi:hypothetical protein